MQLVGNFENFKRIFQNQCNDFWKDFPKLIERFFLILKKNLQPKTFSSYPHHLSTPIHTNPYLRFLHTYLSDGNICITANISHKSDTPKLIKQQRRTLKTEIQKLLLQEKELLTELVCTKKRGEDCDFQTLDHAIQQCPPNQQATIEKVVAMIKGANLINQIFHMCFSLTFLLESLNRFPARFCSQVFNSTEGKGVFLRLSEHIYGLS